MKNTKITKKLSDWSPQVGDVFKSPMGTEVIIFSPTHAKYKSSETIYRISSFVEKYYLVSRAKPQLEVGKEYTTKSGQTFKAIYEEDGNVWMKGSGESIAYIWAKEGSSKSLGYSYDITLDKLTPVKTNVVGEVQVGGCNWGVVVTLKDNDPDWNTLEVLPF